MLFIFDLDQTLVDSKIALSLRSQRNWNAVYNTIPQMKLYPYIRETLDYIASKNHNISIVTTSPGSYASKVLSFFEIKPSSLIAYHDVTRRKPHPESMIKAISKANVLANESISFGDRKIDIEASKQAGIKSCACFWDTTEAEDLRASNPDYSFFTSKEMYDFIIKNW